MYVYQVMIYCVLVKKIFKKVLDFNLYNEFWILKFREKSFWILPNFDSSENFH